MASIGTVSHTETLLEHSNGKRVDKRFHSTITSKPGITTPPVRIKDRYVNYFPIWKNVVSKFSSTHIIRGQRTFRISLTPPPRWKWVEGGM